MYPNATNGLGVSVYEVEYSLVWYLTSLRFRFPGNERLQQMMRDMAAERGATLCVTDERYLYVLFQFTCIIK